MQELIHDFKHGKFNGLTNTQIGNLLKKYLKRESDQRIKDYNVGYTDAQCNHINDAENYVSEQNYLADESNT